MREEAPVEDLDCQARYGPRDYGDMSRAAPPERPKFVVEAFEDIRFDAHEEWLVKRLIPRQGVGVLFGASQSFKSFVLFDLLMSIALNKSWAGRVVTGAGVLYRRRRRGWS